MYRSVNVGVFRGILHAVLEEYLETCRESDIPSYLLSTRVEKMSPEDALIADAIIDSIRRRLTGE
jgi:hypothetical protein